MQGGCEEAAGAPHELWRLIGPRCMLPRASASSRHSRASHVQQADGHLPMGAPESRVSSLLSSRVLFMLSIHRVSTGPSNRIHFWSSDSSLVKRGCERVTHQRQGRYRL